MLSLAYGQDLLNAWTGNAASTITFSSSYIGLFTTGGLPTSVSSSGTEVSTGGGTSYAREQLTSSDFGSSPAANGSGLKIQISNTADIQFAQAGATWGTITGWGIWEASSGGSWRISSANTTWTDVTIGAGDIGRFAAGALTLTAG